MASARALMPSRFWEKISPLSAQRAQRKEQKIKGLDFVGDVFFMVLGTKLLQVIPIETTLFYSQYDCRR
jgi:hypothetical protein